ncbi:hypothetical protein BDV25DRAFT_136846 [Aspergillus avenaceus]|uniref:Uncharacterized protein n=1 Tax=Aspergillus avenaceus TaxID=36643 RepID=A0A5N6U4Q6_ASPAV|nr:hypothetical protein BDV25DRAFT_136846 [Aspergillus avenaceus]
MEHPRVGNTVADALHAYLRRVMEYFELFYYEYSQILRNERLAIERCRRLQEQLQKQQEQAEAVLTQRDNQISLLTQRVSSLVYCPNFMDDDNISRDMRRLGYLVAAWATTNFRKSEQLNRLTAESLRAKDMYCYGDEEPQTFHERLIVVRAVVSWYIYNYIFMWAFVGSGSRQADVDLASVALEIQRQCPSFVSVHWQTATSIGMQTLSRHILNDKCISVCHGVEHILSEYSPTESGSRIHTLSRIVAKCLELKHRMKRQESGYIFFRSPSGHMYTPDSMQNEARTQDLPQLVRSSLWPGLLKRMSDSTLVVQPEIVWTKGMTDYTHDPSVSMGPEASDESKLETGAGERSIVEHQVSSNNHGPVSTETSSDSSDITDDSWIDSRVQ